MFPQRAIPQRHVVPKLEVTVLSDFLQVKVTMAQISKANEQIERKRKNRSLPAIPHGPIRLQFTRSTHGLSFQLLDWTAGPRELLA